MGPLLESLDYDVVNISFDVTAEPKTFAMSLVKVALRFFRLKGMCTKQYVPRGDEYCFCLVFLCHEGLVVAGVCVKEAH